MTDPKPVGLTDADKMPQLSLIRIQRICDQADRGEDISPEDLEYVREVMEAITRAFRPLVEAAGKAAAQIAEAMRPIRVAAPQVKLNPVLQPNADAEKIARSLRAAGAFRSDAHSRYRYR